MRGISLIALFVIISLKVSGQDVFDAARSGNVTRLGELSTIKKDTVNARNAAGFTPLILAGYRGQKQAVEFLLEHQADVNATSPEGPALLGVCYKGDAAIATILIDHHADVNAGNSQGITALMYAAMSGSRELVKLLLNHGAKKDSAEHSGKTALDYARANASKEIVSLLEN